MTVEINRLSHNFEKAVFSAWECPNCQRPNYMKFDGTILAVRPAPEPEARS